MLLDSHTSPSKLNSVSILLEQERVASPQPSSPCNGISSNLGVVDFYQNKTILITGATGFIGKILVEKLLRSCPQLNRIYMIMREKKSKTPEQRLQEMIEASPVFTFHRDQLDLTKLQVITGDLTQPGLGLTTHDRNRLVEEVDVVFHSAASVQFHGELNKFIEQNIDGTNAMMNLCQEMRNVKAIVYVSTAYANCHLLNIEERIYPIHGFPGLVKGDNIEKFIEQIREKYGNLVPEPGHPVLMDRPNAYTLSKSIAENLVQENYSNLPVAVCRPSIVTHSYREPIEGWCDSLNGVSGLLVLGAIGVARNMNVDCECKADIIPVDMVANSLIVIGAYTAMFPEGRQQVIHLTSGAQNPITWGQILDYSREAMRQRPSMKQVRPLAGNPTLPRNRVEGWFRRAGMFFSHYFFALIFDLIMTLIGQKRFMLNLTQRMYRGFDVLEFFSSRQWFFQNGNYQKIFSLLSPNERRMFPSNIQDIDWIKYCENLAIGTRRYLLKEEDSTIEKAKQRQHYLNIGWRIAQILFYVMMIMLLFSYHF